MAQLIIPHIAITIKKTGKANVVYGIEKIATPKMAIRLRIVGFSPNRSANVPPIAPPLSAAMPKIN